MLPGSGSNDAPPETPNPPKISTPGAPSSSTVIPPQQAPREPQKQGTQESSPPTSTPSNSPTPSPSPPPRPKKRRRFRRFLLYSSTLLALIYSGGIYYSLISDDFHDFFTEYIPGGEDAILYFEEREFKRRFPNGVGSSSMYPQVSGENKVTISGQSGAAARVAESKKPDTGASAGITKQDQRPGKTDTAVGKPVSSEGSSQSKESSKVQNAKEAAPKTQKPEAKAGEKEQSRDSKKAESSTPNEAPSKISSAPIAAIDPMSIDNAADPAVQKVTTMLNNLISVINDGNESGKYSATLTKAKEDLQQLGSELAGYKAQQQASAQEQITKNDAEFDRVAKEMLSRAGQEQKDQELRWRDEYENERQRISKTYEDKLNAELEAARKVSDQKLHNELLQQNINLQDSFAQTIRQQVETERDARLSKLNELSTAVSELEKLTTQWNGVVEANMKTQHLVVAVDAVRTALEKADRPTPFLHELAALKESSENNGTVTAAIASIRPAAYQKGLPTIAQLIDRFRRVSSEVRKASLLPEDAGVASHAASFVLSKVLFKKQGLSAGADVESILTRTETLLEEGDLDEAAREMNGLTGWARTLSEDWLTDCRRVLEVRQAIQVSA